MVRTGNFSAVTAALDPRRNFLYVRVAHRPFVGEARNVCFCNGPLEVNPSFCAVSTAGGMLCTGSALGCRLMVFEEERAGPILETRGGLASVQAPPANIAA